MDAIIQTLEKSVPEFIRLGSEHCKNIVQPNEHAKTETICVGVLFDLHIHVEYEAVEKDEGLVITATIKPIRIPEAGGQQ
jgi:hypothetical protein